MFDRPDTKNQPIRICGYNNDRHARLLQIYLGTKIKNKRSLK